VWFPVSKWQVLLGFWASKANSLHRNLGNLLHGKDIYLVYETVSAFWQENLLGYK